MPLHIDIRINEHLISQVHIGRISGGTRPDDINTYRAVFGERPSKVEHWMAGAEYTHRYGDGAEICVQKAFNALFSKGDFS